MHWVGFPSAVWTGNCGFVMSIMLRDGLGAIAGLFGPGPLGVVLSKTEHSASRNRRLG